MRSYIDLRRSAAASFATMRSIVILTGAGISAESGLQTFRAADGLWEGHRVEDVATPEAFARNPALVHQFYDARRARLGEVAPNAAHVALARLDAEWRGDLLIVTQNVDDLHERAGAKRLLHMHGELQQRLVPGMRRAVRLGRDDGRGRRVPVLRSDRPGPPRHRLVRRDALRHGADRGGAARRRSVRVDRHVGRGLSRGGVRPDRAISRRANARNQPRAEPGQHLLRRAPLWAARASKCPQWVDELLAS